MKNMVIATAGHIDHGKTTLIKALTGIETDTTEEEKKRGLSINLGYAYLKLPNKEEVGIVDVPGHEKFIKNMISGLPGLDLVLLVIDANEGIMPQTLEHLDILTLLGLTNFIIVLSKVKGVEPELKELVIADIREQLSQTVLKESEIIETDALSGIGINELINTIQAKKVALKDNHKSLAPSRLNIDRVFSVKGFGTVVTGTLIEGTLALGDELVCVPSFKKTKVRNIQVHQNNVKQASAGQRVALNLANLSVAEVERGNILTVSQNLKLSWMLDAKIKSLARLQTPLCLWERVRLLIGTEEVLARVVPIGSETLESGQEGFVQFRLEKQVAAKQGDRFIIRSYSPLKTIGGGLILDSAPTKHRRFKEEVINSLTLKDQGSKEELLLDFLQNNVELLTSLVDLSAYLSLDLKEIEELVGKLRAAQEIIHLDQYIVATTTLAQVERKILTSLNQYHKKYRLRPWMPIEEFRSQLKLLLPNRKLNLVLREIEKRGAISLAEQGIKAADFEIRLNIYQQKEQQRINNSLASHQFNPVKVTDLTSQNKNMTEVLEYMAGRELIYLTHEYVIAKDYFELSCQMVTDLITKNKKLTLADFRDQTKSSRKSSMLILEYLDKIHLTKRVENYRVLAN